MPGPTTLFDKFFLQNISVDESVWFDHFFHANVCRVFYAETLADLSKKPRAGLTPEQEVARIADKFPEMNSYPCVSHKTLTMASLLGHPVPMNGQIMVSGGRPVRSEGETGVIHDRSPESEAFTRWTRREFVDLERTFARDWREALSTLDLEAVAEVFRSIGIDGRSCATLQDAKAQALALTSDFALVNRSLDLSLLFLNADEGFRSQVMERSRLLGRPRFGLFAPYAAHVLTVEVFFQIALASGLISSERASNRVDLAYLFYLPFCMLFVSSDKLHARCAPLFLRDDQKFLWGLDLKDGLAELNRHYKALAEDERQKGIMSFAERPPIEGSFLVSRIFDEHFPGWRERPRRSVPINPESEKRIVELVNRFSGAPSLPSDSVFMPSEARMHSIRRSVRKKKGSWYQVPKHLKE